MRQFLTDGFHCDFMGFNKALKDALLLPRARRGVARCGVITPGYIGIHRT